MSLQSPDMIELGLFLSAARDGDLAGVRSFLQRHGKNYVDSKPNHGMNSALEIAAEHGRTDVVLCLLDNGANIEQQDTDNMTPFMTALWFGKLETAQALLARGARIDKTSHGDDVLLQAIRNKRADVVEWLLSLDVSLSRPDSNGFNALELAQIYKNEAITGLIKTEIVRREKERRHKATEEAAQVFHAGTIHEICAVKTPRFLKLRK